MDFMSFMESENQWQFSQEPTNVSYAVLHHRTLFIQIHF
jgi:hypothetical protein